MTAAAAFGVDAGGGFIVGATLVFMFLSMAVLRSREMEQIERVALSQHLMGLLVKRLVRAIGIDVPDEFAAPEE